MTKGSTVEESKQEIRVAFSPDADDAFMFFGIDKGLTDTRGLRIRTEMADIESLNTQAGTGALDVTAISFGAWPELSERYDLLTVGSSFGLGYGPKLVSLKADTLASLAGKTVGVPGEKTSAALLLRLCLPEARTVAVPFTEIPARIKKGELDAGVVIHESQLTYAREGFELVEDLGEWWSRETDGLPLPLGANVVRRELSDEIVTTFKDVMRDSILKARERRTEALEYALQFGRDVSKEEGSQFVDLYVNDLTLDPGEEGRRAVTELYKRGAAAGLMPTVEARWR